MVAARLSKKHRRKERGGEEKVVGRAREEGGKVGLI